MAMPMQWFRGIESKAGRRMEVRRNVDGGEDGARKMGEGEDGKGVEDTVVHHPVVNRTPSHPTRKAGNVAPEEKPTERHGEAGRWFWLEYPCSKNEALTKLSPAARREDGSAGG